ncbi:flagellar hook-length control protein FliK [Pukyongiella litopenaei]|uniref:Flagellar hook-length control protein FliK n=1 Tax=Pukyongiella litopenaei TaxID=2605946 RepID=A0A2S0MRT3_9RHOB|nr:flagellar hook-length control protein FliK [Pukyongiella litopenaei]AVO38556.2 flagellar hook-length control protein FliK [Pukyongiella litopenaei]
MTDPVLSAVAEMIASGPAPRARAGGEGPRGEDFGSVLSRQKDAGNDMPEAEAADLPGLTDGEVQVAEAPDAADQCADDGARDPDTGEIRDVRPAPDAGDLQRQPAGQDTDTQIGAEAEIGDRPETAARPAIRSVAEIVAAAGAAPADARPSVSRAEEGVTPPPVDHGVGRATGQTVTHQADGSAQLATGAPARHTDTISAKPWVADTDRLRLRLPDTPVAGQADALASRPVGAAQAPDFNTLHRIFSRIGDSDIAPADDLPGLELRGVTEAADAAGQRVRPATSDAPPTRAGHAPFRFETVVEVAARNHNRMFEIALSPEELGRVRMSLMPSEQGVTVQIFAERQETIDLLRRHSDQLASEFQRLGYDSTGFEFSGGDAEKQGQDDRFRPHDQSTVTGAESSAAIPVARVAMSSGVDMRV